MGRKMEWAARADHMKGVPRKMVIMAVGAFAKVVANFLNTTSVHNADTLINLVQSRPPGVPLISVSNHMSTSVPVSFFLFHFFFPFFVERMIVPLLFILHAQMKQVGWSSYVGISGFSHNGCGIGPMGSCCRRYLLQKLNLVLFFPCRYGSISESLSTFTISLNDYELWFFLCRNEHFLLWVLKVILLAWWLFSIYIVWNSWIN